MNTWIEALYPCILRSSPRAKYMFWLLHWMTSSTKSGQTKSFSTTDSRHTETTGDYRFCRNGIAGVNVGNTQRHNDKILVQLSFSRRVLFWLLLRVKFIGGSPGTQFPESPYSFTFMQFLVRSLQNDRIWKLEPSPQENPGSATEIGNK